MNSNLDGLKELGNIKKVHRNASIEELRDYAVEHEGASISSSGALMIDTGEFTGRSPKDKYIVNTDPSNKYVSWGSINQPTTHDVFDKLFAKAKKQLSDKELFVTDVYCGSSEASKVSVRVISELAWQSHFVENMFIMPTEDELANFKSDFIIYNACKTVNDEWEKDELHSDVFVVFNIEDNIAVIGGTWYAGEIKKGVFSMMNYWLPLQNKLSMHCSANIGNEHNDTALFFGLSGTGKTTLSTDPKRRLIGDDEHGWDDEGVFNFEGGCYAKVINLSGENEPEIFGAIKKGAILENVVADENGNVDYKDGSKTENTRVSYPINHIINHEPTLSGNHPKNIIFLSADAFGVLPPVSKLTKEQAMYYFLSGYTAKVAGTERGITEPVATFSACFGEAFLPLHPTAYAKLLGEKIDKYEVNVYLVNTGWTGGAYGVGHRMSIKNTRACIDGILDGSITNADFDTLPLFNLAIPKTLNGVDTEVLNPRNSWEDKSAYDESAKKLASMFVDNFNRYNDSDSEFDYSGAGPKV
jgi:phosphoenolpyruvate carboxykinase (ATP)